ncbi:MULTISPECIES: DUF7315 family membrane protein [Halorubrum]|uniref:DUF7315 domain-containing protein n=1 Tax=Halorubrum sodomense TaxID=35743 RepID=A0A1I6G8K0_HALSD|nr:MULTISPECIES: hypothetical protein [Halorubrum]TKX53753.1 hypothetical protein EXE42_11645 [Halorubrum sp. SP3]TKX69419.1 hypothetical protein EXE45_08575 [Halorubrum sp. SP9]SFR38470.1 hypothetical protein SAMN04487937_1733 [Halorubrum sodomense]
MTSSSDGDSTQSFDETGDPIAGDDDADPRSEPTGPRAGPGGREVVVPFRLYKAVTVFSTLAAVVTFLIGFTLVDAATLQISFVRTIIVYLLDNAGILPPEDVLVAILAITGVGFILLGTAVYVLGTRFRGQGMGKSQDDPSET